MRLVTGFGMRWLQKKRFRNLFFPLEFFRSSCYLGIEIDFDKFLR